MRRQRAAIIGAAAIAAAALVAAAIMGPLGALAHVGSERGGQQRIQHVVVIFQENVSFDHYFGTYPNATNPAGEPAFTPRPGTPSVNGLTPDLLAHNPNLANPQRLDHSQAVTCDQDHSYKDEQAAVDNGKMDKFVQDVSGGSCVKKDGTPAPSSYGQGKNIVMDYYDGNTVTALWNYAQHFAMSDNSYDTNYGPSTVGAINLISGQTHGFTPDGSAVTGNNTIVGDPQPAGDICDTRDTSTQLPASTDKNVGDLLNAKGITWGWFQGGFRESSGATVNGLPTTNTCLIAHKNLAGGASADYIAHHEPFQYYRSTQNLQHLPPGSVAMIGHTDQANHQYDLGDFWAAVNAGKMPAVSYLKAAAYQDGHGGYSDPLDEQTFLVNTINQLEQRPEWSSTAIVIAYDDSDGWYDHTFSPVVNGSNDPAIDSAFCANSPIALGTYQDRCAYGPRLPLLVISPYAKTNFVDHQVTDQSSILRFVEDNWDLGRIGDQSFDAIAGDLGHMLTADAKHSAAVILDPSTGETV
jgi:phospholipase C